MDIDITVGAGLPADGTGETGDRASANSGGRTSLAEPTLLCALATRAMHGYDLKSAVLEMTGGFLSLDPAGMYRMLRRLETEGLVESSWTPGESGPQRREYTLTESGRAMLADWRQFLIRQRRACLLMADAIDVALGIEDHSAGSVDTTSRSPAGPGGGA